MLGLSLGRLLELSEGLTLVRALCQLVEEYEHFIGAKKDVLEGGPFSLSLSSSGSLTTLLAGSSDTSHHHAHHHHSHHHGLGGGGGGQIAPFLFLGSAHGSAHGAAVMAVAAQAAAAQASAQASSGGAFGTSGCGGGGGGGGAGGGGGGGSDAAGAIKPSLHKVAKIGVVYDYLHTHATCMPDQLDYCEVVQSLCDVLSLIYSKFLHPNCSPPAVHDAILRVDKRLKSLVLAKITNDLVVEVAQPMLKIDLRNLLNHTFIDDKTNAPAGGGGGGGGGSGGISGTSGAGRKFIQLDENNSSTSMLDEEDDEDDGR